MRFENGKLEGTLVKTANSSLWDNEQHAVYVDENGEGYFGVPQNLYFLGTMNDIDKSVDSFDMALRRRFVWRHYECDYEAICKKYEGDENAQKYVSVCKALNEKIS